MSETYRAIKYNVDTGAKIADIDAEGWFIFEDDTVLHNPEDGFYIMFPLSERKAVAVVLTEGQLIDMLNTVQHRSRV